MDALKALENIAKALGENKLYQFSPYPWQKEFFSWGKDTKERALFAANRVGKTYSAAREVAYHLTGIYPDWWEGRRYDFPIKCWAAGVSNESLRDIIQAELLGGLGEDLGTGAIPRNLIGKITKRQCGVSDVVDTVHVKHVSGGWSTITMKSYEQGWKKFQGTAPHVVWLDEEPDDFQIYSECKTRILTSKGIMIITFTPLSGVTSLVQHFREGHPGTRVKNVTWDDTPHLSEQDKAEFLAGCPSHERDARTRGLPMMGQGRVFDIDETSIKIKPFQIPDYFRQIIGIDFGWDHPAATVKIVYDPDKDTYYVVDAHKATHMKPLDHAEQIKKMGGGIYTGKVPIAWPHDGLNTEKGRGDQLISTYKGHDLNLLSMTARHKNDVGGSQSVEKTVMEMYEMMVTGRFKVFDSLSHWFEEFRNYHRKDNKIVDKMDDLLAATRYAFMMRRYAVPKYINREKQFPSAYL
jgi:phage terminase large subunit-like protein